MPMNETEPPPSPAREGLGAARPTILIVDDSPVDRRLAAAIVTRRGGLRVATAANGREALEIIARDPPAAVLTDLQMPEMNGLELVEEVRREYPGVPVILMTAFGSEEIALHALRAGAASYVPKRSLAQELGDTLDTVLSLGALDRRRHKLLKCLDSSRMSFRLENDPELIAPLIAKIQEDLDGMGLCDGNRRTRIGVALQECLANALYHGNLEVSSDLRQEDERRFYALADARRRRPPYCQRHIHVLADLNRDSVAYTIRDEGPGFETAKLDEPFDPETLTRVGGRGMLLIRTFMDEVRHNAAGNEITMIKRN